MIEEALHVITDPGHLLAEVILEVVSYATVGRLAIWWHDRVKHPEGHQEPLVAELVRYGPVGEPRDRAARLTALDGIERCAGDGEAHCECASGNPWRQCPDCGERGHGRCGGARD